MTNMSHIRAKKVALFVHATVDKVYKSIQTAQFIKVENLWNNPHH